VAQAADDHRRLAPAGSVGNPAQARTRPRPQPDLYYLEKLAEIVGALEQALNSEGRIVIVFADEFTFYRQPSLAPDYCEGGSTHQRLAHRSHRSDCSGRVIGGLHAVSGKVTSRMTSKVTLSQMVNFLQALREAYPQAEVIYLVVDNWPIHYHPDVLAALAPQQTQWELKVPASWPSEASRRAKRLNLPIQLLPYTAGYSLSGSETLVLNR
jgi:DDE superfamily endonuclease